MPILTIGMIFALVLNFSRLSLADEIWLGRFRSNSVGILDRSSSVLIDEVALDQDAEDVDFSADGKTAFATPSGFPSPSGIVKIINADTRQVTGEIDIGASSDVQIERRPNSSRLYIGNCGNREELLIIDGDAASAIDLDPSTPGVQGIALPNTPWKMPFSPDRHFAYATVCDPPPSAILKIDLQQNAYVKTIPSSLPFAVNSLAVSDDGTLAVVAGGGFYVGIIDLTTDSEVAAGEIGGSNCCGVNDGVAIDNARQRAYVLNFFNGVASVLA
jgi:DNA-binding beta-propeller fold protein YncE